MIKWKEIYRAITIYNYLVDSTLERVRDANVDKCSLYRDVIRFADTSI